MPACLIKDTCCTGRSFILIQIKEIRVLVLETELLQIINTLEYFCSSYKVGMEAVSKWRSGPEWVKIYLVWSTAQCHGCFTLVSRQKFHIGVTEQLKEAFMCINAIYDLDHCSGFELTFSLPVSAFAGSLYFWRWIWYLLSLFWFIFIYFFLLILSPFLQDNKRMKRTLEEEQRARKELERIVRRVLKNMNDPTWDETNLWDLCLTLKDEISSWLFNDLEIIEPVWTTSCL